MFVDPSNGNLVARTNKKLCSLDMNSDKIRPVYEVNLDSSVSCHGIVAGNIVIGGSCLSTMCPHIERDVDSGIDITANSTYWTFNSWKDDGTEGRNAVNVAVCTKNGTGNGKVVCVRGMKDDGKNQGNYITALTGEYGNMSLMLNRQLYMSLSTLTTTSKADLSTGTYMFGLSSQGRNDDYNHKTTSNWLKLDDGYFGRIDACSYDHALFTRGSTVKIDSYSEYEISDPVERD